MTNRCRFPSIASANTGRKNTVSSQEEDFRKSELFATGCAVGRSYRGREKALSEWLRVNVQDKSLLPPGSSTFRSYQANRFSTCDKAPGLVFLGRPLCELTGYLSIHSEGDSR